MTLPDAPLWLHSSGDTLDVDVRRDLARSSGLVADEAEAPAVSLQLWRTERGWKGVLLADRLGNRLRRGHKPIANTAYPGSFCASFSANIPKNLRTGAGAPAVGARPVEDDQGRSGIMFDLPPDLFGAAPAAPVQASDPATNRQPRPLDRFLAWLSQ